MRIIPVSVMSGFQQVAGLAGAVAFDRAAALPAEGRAGLGQVRARVVAGRPGLGLHSPEPAAALRALLLGERLPGQRRLRRRALLPPADMKPKPPPIDHL